MVRHKLLATAVASGLVFGGMTIGNAVDHYAIIGTSPTVKTGTWVSEGVSLQYPVVHMGNRVAMKEINDELNDEVEHIIENVLDLQSLGGSMEATMNYEVTYMDNDLLSLIVNTMTYPKGAAHPMSFKKGFVFRLRDGKDLKLADLKHYSQFAKEASDFTLPAVNEALLTYAMEKQIPLFDKHLTLNKVPKDIYIDKDGHVHVVFQHYEVAPYSSGIIDVPVTK